MNLHQLKNLFAWNSIRNKEPAFDEAFEALKQHSFEWSHALIQKLIELSPHPPRLIAADFAEMILPIWESSEFARRHPKHRVAPRKAIEAARKGNAEETKKAADAANAAANAVYAAQSAANAAWRAAADAAWSAAYAAWSAAYAADAAWSAVYAARSAAYAANAAYAAWNAWSAANAADIKNRQIEICLERVK